MESLPPPPPPPPEPPVLALMLDGPAPTLALAPPPPPPENVKLGPNILLEPPDPAVPLPLLALTFGGCDPFPPPLPDATGAEPLDLPGLTPPPGLP